MSFPRYPEYSCYEESWFSELPSHWGVGSMRWLAKRFSGGTPDKTNLSYWESGTIPWLNSGAVNDRIITEPSTYITEEAFDGSSAKWVPQGALVIALAGQGKTKGMVAQLAIPSTCNQSMAAIVPGERINARFLFWWLESNYQNIRNMSGGDLRDGLNLELLGNIECPLPPPIEQSLVASFLDTESAKIDVLVAEQEKLMALLKEKRQAVISHAVTKGLDPAVPMKDSGVEWLGEVPAHWEVLPLRWFFSCSSGGGIDVSRIEREMDVNQVPVIGGNGVMGFTDTSNVSGQVLAIGRVGALCGNVHLVSPPAWITDNALVLSSSTNEFDLVYLSFLLRSRNLNEIAAKTAQPLITGTQVQDQRMPCPPRCEQLSIVEFIEKQIGDIDQLYGTATEAISLLQERRTALISAAVTGKIDVRGAAKALAA